MHRIRGKQPSHLQTARPPARKSSNLCKCKTVTKPSETKNVAKSSFVESNGNLFVTIRTHEQFASWFGTAASTGWLKVENNTNGWTNFCDTL